MEAALQTDDLTVCDISGDADTDTDVISIADAVDGASGGEVVVSGEGLDIGAVFDSSNLNPLSGLNTTLGVRPAPVLIRIGAPAPAAVRSMPPIDLDEAGGEVVLGIVPIFVVKGLIVRGRLGPC